VPLVAFEHPLARRLLVGLLCAVGALALLLAIAVPFHATDALIYGRWSKEIAQAGHFTFPDVGNAYLHRPLFYASQGWLWWIFGVHEWMGRILALAIGVLFVWTTAALAGGDRRLPFAGAVTAAVMLACPEVMLLGFSGLTDVPVAAFCGAAAAALWAGRTDARWRIGAVAAAGAAAMLTKPSAVPALVALGVVHLVVGERREWRSRLVRGSVPLALGTAVALAYDQSQASRLHQSLNDFLHGAIPATDPLYNRIAAFYLHLRSNARETVVLPFQWLGPYLGVPLIFGLTYGGLRVIGLAHRMAATVAAVLAAVGCWVLPIAAGQGVTSGPFDNDRPVAALMTIVLAVAMFAARRCPDVRAPSRTLLARLLLWAIPMTVVWVAQAPDNTRYLSPVWPALFALMGLGIVIAVRGAGRWAPVVLAVVALGAVADLRNLDNLHATPSGEVSAWTFARSISAGDVFHSERLRAAADPQLSNHGAADEPRSAGDGDPAPARGRGLPASSGHGGTARESGASDQ